TVQTYLVDVADRTGYADIAQQFLAKNGGIDLLINNAGVGDGSPFMQYSLDNWDWMLSINLMGVVHGCYYFVPAMQAQKSGHIINIASIAGVANGPFMSAYNVSKAGVRSLSETLDHELTPFGVDVTAVMPGFFKTNVMQHARGNAKFLTFGHKMMERSEIDALGVALEILTGAGAKKRDVFPTKLAKRSALMKRLLPGYFRKLMKKQVPRG
ncbi:MAG: SDR family NAD(P)-dependent oxidoreductase, partial [Bacteroidota bacterium]